MTRMCASINHALTSFVSHSNHTHLTILLDGGRLSKMVYEENSTIFVDPTKILSLTLKPFPSSKYSPLITNSGNLISLFRSSSAPTITIHNIDFYKLLLVQFTTAQNTTGALRVSESHWEGLHSHGYMDKAFINGGGGQLKNVQIDIELTDFTMDSIVANVLPLINYNQLDDTKWHITLLRGQLNNVGLHAIVKESTINVTNTNIAGFLSNAQYSIDLQGFHSIRMDQIHFEHCTGANYGTFNFRDVGELVITNTHFVDLLNNYQVIRASHIHSVQITNCRFEGLGTNTESLGFSYVNSFEFTDNNVALINNDGYRGTFLSLSYIDKINLTGSKFENDHEISTISTVVISYSKEVFIAQTNMIRQRNPLTISETVQVKLSQCQFQLNKAKKGAGITVSGYTTVTIVQCDFLHNQAVLQSGAIDSDNANFFIENSTFIGNTANTCGTFRFSGTNTTSVTLTNVVISTPVNELPQFAVVLENNGPKLMLENVTIDVKSSHGDIDIFTTNLSDTSSFQYNCPPNTNVTQKQKALFSCQHCDKDKYSRQASSIAFNHSGAFVNAIECVDCPFGGSCTGQGEIASLSNFWGSMDYGSIKFVQCLSGYCCDESEGRRCIGIKSCAPYRTGPVCAKCIEGYHVKYFDNNCTPIKNCAPRYLFWMFFTIITVFFLP